MPQEPFLNIRHLPWIPVTRTDGTETTIGLQEFLETAHQLTVLNIHRPLEHAGVLKFLQSVTALIIREAAIDEHNAGTYAENGVPKPVITAALNRVDNHLWLIHPEHPFLQQPRYTEASTDWNYAVSIRPGQPTGEAKAWVNRPGDPYTPKDLTAEETVIGLCASWFYGFNSNAQQTVTGGQLRNQGSIQCRKRNIGAKLWRQGPSLLHTLLMNTPASWAAGTAVPAWVNEPVVSGDAHPLIQGTITGIGVLLRHHRNTDGTVTFDGARIGGVYRNGIFDKPEIAPSGRTKLSAVDTLKQSLDLAFKSDPNTLWRENLENPGESVPNTTLSPYVSVLENARRWVHDAKNPPLPAPGILADPRTVTGYSILTIETEGSMYQQLKDAAWYSIPIPVLGDGLSAFTDYASDIEKLVRRGTYVIFGTDTKDSRLAARSTATQIMHEFYQSMDGIAGDVIARTTNGEPFTVDDLHAWRAAAIEAFDVITEPYLSARTLPNIADARATLSRYLRKRFENTEDTE